MHEVDQDVVVNTLVKMFYSNVFKQLLGGVYVGICFEGVCRVFTLRVYVGFEGIYK